MITEDYVSFEIAKLLKEKGFDWTTEHKIWYVIEQFSTGCHWNSCTYKVGDKTREYDEKCCISIPTLQMAMKWLREVHKIHINTVYLGPTLKWTPTIWEIDMTIPESKHIKSTLNTWESYEDACEAAIKYCLENLI